jgi:transposase
MTVSITRSEHTPADLRREAGRTADARGSRRMLALALVMEGESRETAARQCGMDRQTLRDWVHRYNAMGVAGLFDRPHGGGASPKLTGMQEATLAGWVRAGPDLETDGVVRWRVIDLRQKIAREFNVELHERSVGKLLRRLRFRRLSVRPRHPEADPAAQETHKKPCRSGRRRHSARSSRQANRALAAGRSACRPARQPDLHLGGTGQPPDRATRSPLRLGVHFRRRLPGARHWRRPGSALCRR